MADVALRSSPESLADRLHAVWNHLGIDAAHVATQIPGDIADFATAHPGRVGGLVFCAPTRIDPGPFVALAKPVLLIAGDRGLPEAATARAAARLPGARRFLLDDYDAASWADIAAERTTQIVDAMRDFLMETALPPAAPLAGRSGTHAGIRYEVEGSGPPLVLLPFFLAPTQWDAAIPALARDFTVINLGGVHLGGLAALEDRARTPSYRAMLRSLFDLIDPQPGETILDVGCGTGALDRLLARRYGSGNPLTAADVSPFLLREAALLTEAEGLAGGIRFQHADAQSLPFPDAAFDCVFTVTVLEECDADLALTELFRVLRPGGRAGVIVRAIDLPQWWNLPLTGSLRDKATPPPQSVAPRGVADASLYRRMRDAGFVDLRPFPTLVTLDNPNGPIWRYREDHVRGLLSADETAEWAMLVDAARRDGLLCMAHPLHCAVALKPTLPLRTG